MSPDISTDVSADLSTDPQRPAGLIAILRGLAPHEAPTIGAALYEAGIRSLEVPLNSPDPFASIELLSQQLPEDCRVGAGTVVTAEDVGRVRDAGGQMVVAPNTAPAVIARAVELGLEPMPGVATATDVFSALHAGATRLKIFPAPTVGIGGMRAWSAVVPAGTQFLPVGGIDADTLGPWLQAGAQGAGIGSQLYAPGSTPEQVRAVATQLVQVWAEHRP